MPLATQQPLWHDQIRRGGVWFDRKVQRAHRRLRQNVPSYVREGSVGSLLTAPVVYALLLPFALLDICVWVYQWVCFPVYGIGHVPRRSYFVMDRRRLAYLNGIEKINCTFCSYANGVIGYVREVAARTEQYWCPIKHARSIADPHERYRGFFDFGDARGYRAGLTTLRRTLPPRSPSGSPLRPGRGRLVRGG